MHLSIFNFKKPIKFIIFFLIIYTTYNIYIYVKNPNITLYQNQWQQNYVFAESFLYGNKPSTIIVGSSMAVHLDKSILTNEIYNLSFSGGSVLTGLKILKMSNYIPKTIYIENNVIFRKMDNEMIESLFDPIKYNLKKYIPALKEKYQPLNIIVSILKSKLGRTENEKMNKVRDENVFQISFKRQLVNYKKPLDNYEFELSELTELLKYFQSKNTKIIFFEMPINNILANEKRANQQRDIIRKHFPTYDWLPLPNNNLYLTSDGIHLMYKSSIEFTTKFYHMSISNR